MDDPTTEKQVPVPDYMVAAEQRAHDLRASFNHVLKIAGVPRSTWWRGKRRGFLRATTIAKVEEALDYLDRAKRESARGQ